MKKALLTALLVFSAWGTMKAQLYVDGDINKDGIVNVADVAQLANKIINETPKSPEALIAGTWQRQDGEVLTLNEDGTTDYEGASTFKYKANEKYIYMYDSAGSIAHLFSVETISSAYMVLKQLGQNESKLYYNEFLIQHPVVEVVHDTIVEYKVYEPTIGEEFKAVDLGLPSGKLWANMNLYANSPEEVGYYYAWGEEYRKSSYKSNNYVGGKFIDLAEKTLGEGWSMPTKDEFQELIDYCICANDTLAGVAGMRYTGFNGNSVFIPRNGYIDGEKKQCSTSIIYPSKTTYSTSYIYCLKGKIINYFGTISSSNYNYYRYYGYNIRAIYKPKE